MKLRELQIKFLAADQSWLAAHHEAGHAVISWMKGEWVRAPGLTVDRFGNGHTQVRRALVFPRDKVPSSFRKEADATVTMSMAALLAGYSAEWKLLGGMPPVSTRPWLSDDYHAALDCASQYWQVDQESPTVRRAFFRAQRKCNSLLEEPKVWGTLKALAGRLEQNRSVNEDEAEEVLMSGLGDGWLATGEQLVSSRSTVAGL